MSEGYSIICVDDDPDILRIYNNILKRRGYNVRCCEGATQFFNTWEEKPLVQTIRTLG